ncbi:hypothetical protein CC1G_09118 [Coprinopsis cinerea okayama7|uniref:U3 small nucleolar RNA-associated protein 10 n=1 Tax=Coprinopsis cinerea (strain Okayama-7 / 130 / ATCC MYA-4618 / FGSC 9003) TaxID=240176 RepID=A8NJ71_COPC7|nr:hypothetical protein CC1G_09118 [Coprinopsis cinerea okayama7\|eukprot:XP_001834161.2 hypothetical protein CC1G_09118 [Coprinopsis cinerea okayama7\
MSSLQAQLSKNASLNAALYVDRARRKPQASYLFTGRDADKYDLETIHALGVNAFLQLASVCPALEKYEDALFSDRARNTDRTLLSPDAVEELNRAIGEFLVRLGPYLLEAPTGKAIEWLVKRFRIHEFNIDSLVSLFLPYHETPHFTKIISILDLKPNTLWSFLIPYKSAAQNIQRVSLVSEMIKNVDVARFVTSLLPYAIKGGYAHRTLLSFNAATVHEFIKRSNRLSEGVVAFLLPALLEPLQQKSETPSKDAILGSYILLATLSQKCGLAPPALKVIIGALASSARHVSAKQFVSAALAVCQPQTDLEKVSESTVNAMLKLRGINEEITAACKWHGSEKLLLPIVTKVVPKLTDPNIAEFLENLVSSPTVPEPVLMRLTSLLVKTASSNESSLSERKMLGTLQQRHPAVVQKVTKELIDEDDDSKDTIEQLILSLSVTQNIPASKTTPGLDVIIASTHADANVREIAVKKLLAALSGADDVDSVRSALLARLFDDNVGVLESLYSNPTVLAQSFLAIASEYVDTLSKAIASPGAKPKRAVLRLHLGFLSDHILATLDSEQQTQIFERIFFPFLLFSKPRQHTAELIWDLIAEKHAGTFELLKGAADIWAKQKASERGIEEMVELNSGIAEKIADNIIRSDDFSKHLEDVVGRLNDDNSWSRSLAFLVVRALLENLSDSHQHQAGKAVLEALNLETLPSIEDLSEDQSFEEAVRGDVIGRYVVAKPNSKTTLGWLQVSGLAAVAKIPKPLNKSVDWFKAVEKACLLKKLYKLANSSGSLPAMSMGLLQALFNSLGGDALVFLAGIWTISDDELIPLQGLALLHATAFLEAHAQEQDELDFQTILPALLVALQNPVAQCRAASLECVARLRIIAGGNLSHVYKFDVVYGPQNQELQYLDKDDLVRYLDALLEHKDHFHGDAGYLALFHGQYLVKNAGDRKRDSEYRKRVLCYLLSHINAVSSPDVRVSLLRSVQSVQDKAKLQLLLPTIQSLLVPGGVYSEELASSLVSSFNSSTSRDLNDTAKPYWKVFTDVLRKYLPLGPTNPISGVLAAGLLQGLFEKLDQQRKIELCDVLLEICSDHVESHIVCKELLSTVLKDIPVTVALLNSLSPSNKATDRAIKRAKTNEPEQPNISKLTFFAEALTTQTLPGSVDLISHLLQALSSVVQALSAAQADVNYTEQLLMSAIDSAASQVKELPNISPSAIRLDVLVELIRVTDNPQTFHQALILMSNLTRLAPDSVLHNIMPVFTFMGSNVFHRDDASSFNVTIDGIVPVMVSSLKKSATSPLQLAIEAKDFLHIFTDAANHIPRHRRTKFFSHLVTVLGPQDFLAAVCMLLAEKLVNKAVRQTEDDARTSLSLPISLLSGTPLPTRIQAIVAILEEVERLSTRVVDPSQASPTFLSAPSDSDQGSSSVVYRRRAQALLILVGLSFDTPLLSAEDVPLDQVVAKMITLSTPPQALDGADKLRDVSLASQKALGQFLSVMPAKAFLSAIASILQTDDTRVQVASLDLLSQRVPDLSAKARQDSAATIVQIFGHLKRLIPRESDAVAVSAAALRALTALASTLEPQEHGSAAELVPFALKATANQEIVVDAWQSLLPMSNFVSRNLGPRIIPHFRSIVQASIGDLGTSDHPAVPVIQSTLQGLLASIPTFWAAPEVLSLFTLYIDQSIDPAAGSLLNLIKSVTKRVPAKILLPTLLDMWPPVQNPLNLDRMAAYFELVFRSLHNADRAAVLEHLRPVFKLFLEALGYAVPDHKLEANIISAFRELVVKLNETAFRPLFRRLYDWAFAADKDDSSRKIVFIHLYLGLQDYFKGLMSPYMSFLLQPFEETLKGYSSATHGDQSLWTATISSLHKALTHDDGGFWRNDKLRQISNTLAQQVATAINLGFGDGKDLLRDCLIALVEATNDDTLLKLINLNILMHTRSEDARLRLYALNCSVSIWQACGVKLLGFVAETATFIAECSEDENDMVVKESLRLKHAVENVAGKIEEL